VQKRIYQSLGSTKEFDPTKEFDRKVWEAYVEAIGWKQKGEEGWWLSYYQLTFNTNAPLAHLPAGLVWREYEFVKLVALSSGSIYVVTRDAGASLVQRSVKCKL
jgi:GUN4-like